MAKLVQGSDGRYQNVSHILVSVQKDAGRGHKSVALTPGATVKLTEDDVQASIDVYKSGKDPFGRGFVKQIPEGQQDHPEKPNLGKHPNTKKTEEVFHEGSMQDVKSLINMVGDIAGITKLRRVLSVVEPDISKKREREIDVLIDRKHEKVEREYDRLKSKYDEKLGD